MWHYRTMPSPALIPRADPCQPRSQVHTRTGSKWNLWNYISRYHWQSALDGLPEKFFLIYRPTETSKTPLSYYSTDGIATTDSSVLYGIPLPANLQCLLFEDFRKSPSQEGARTMGNEIETIMTTLEWIYVVELSINRLSKLNTNLSSYKRPIYLSE